MTAAQKRLIDAAAEAFCAEDRGRRSFCGLSALVERLTDLLIEAMFPRHAVQEIPAVERLTQGAALLRSCLTISGASDPDAVVEILLRAKSEGSW